MEKCKLRITCAGIYNAGKSSLLNALTGGNNFAVGDIPTTATIDEFETDKYIYVDTPGLNANNYDNATAEKAFRNADLILFVSNMQNGGLNAAEAEYLKKLSETLGGMEILQAQVLFAMSNLHQIEDDAVNKVIEEHKSMINLALGFVPETVCVFDSVTYQEGLSSNESVLIEASGIPALVSQIEISAGYVESRLETLRSERILSQYRILRDSLNQLIAPMKKEYDRLKKIVDSESVDESKVIDIINQYRKKNVGCGVYGGSFSMDFKRKYYNRRSDMYKNYASKSALIEAMKRTLSRLYNNRRNAVTEKARESAECLKSAGCYEHTSGNDYFHKINEINQNIIDLNNILSENNINLPVELLQNFDIKYSNYPNMSYDSIYNQIVEGTMDSLSYGNSLDEYIEDYGDIREGDVHISNVGSSVLGTLVRGFSGGHSYSCTDDDIIAEKICTDLDKAYESSVKSISNQLERYLNNFCDYLNRLYTERLNKIESEVRNIIQIKNNTDTKKQLDKLWEEISPLLNRIEEMENNL
ncbi:MAG: 50S ribosome-binding GTPase [Ruminococcus sp.]|nr:50S ribosome-binding GTPase [Ruminococcus sp.]